MKSIDTNKFDEMFFGKLDKKLSAVKSKKEKLEKELDDLRATLETEEAKLTAVKDDVTAYKSQFHKVSDIKVDILALEHLLDVTEEDISALNKSMPEYWKKGIESYSDLIQPYIEVYNTKKKEALDIFLQITKAQNEIRLLGTTAIGRYKFTDKQLMSEGLFGRMTAPLLDEINPVAARYFYNDCLKLANGDHSEAKKILNGEV